MRKCVFLLVMSLLVLNPTWSQGSEDSEAGGAHDEPAGTIINGIKYLFFENKDEKYEKFAWVSGGNCWEGDLVIPSEVEHDGQIYTVTSLSWKAFRNCKTIKKVTIPNTLTYLAKYWSWADYSQFWVPFVGCTALESIEVDADNPHFCSVDGVMYTKDMADLVCFPAGSKQKYYTVPNGVKRIYQDAFSYNSNLVSVTFPKTVTDMYTSFQSCTALETVVLPKNLSAILPNMFSGCTSLKSIEIPATVTTVSECAFEDCSSLTTIELPNVSRIDNNAFKGCNSLKSLIIRGYLDEHYHFVQLSPIGIIPEQTIIYCQPEQVDKLKQLVSNTVLPLDEYQPEADAPTAIESAIKDAPANIPTYDLQGRRIETSKFKVQSSKIKRGEYIENGRKVVVK